MAERMAKPTGEVEVARRSCQQIVSDGDDCCASNNGVCAASAAWEHAETGAALCELHARNAELLGGLQLGYWVVGETRVPYPDGWTRVEDGRPLMVAAQQQRPGGLVLP